MAGQGAPGGYLTGLHARWLAERPGTRHREIEGTLLFADVSGFTVLGEKLARQGRIGSEILTETVNTVFAGMLDTVTDEGGEILKFGGDAILAFFSGRDHAIRGCSAGLGLQAMLRALRRDRSVNLRLSAGVASGQVNLFLAGAAPRELIVAGPVATDVLTQEAAAEAGQVLVSPTTAAALPERCLGAATGPGVLLRAAPAAPPVAPPAPPEGFDPRPALPLHLHDHVPGDAEHRSVTVAFVQFKGTDALLAAEGPAALARALDDVVGAAAEAALAHGITFVGTDVDRDAGKIILAAGAPTASPDDDDRMLHALRAVVGAPRALAVRAGVNRGRVFTVDIGPQRRRTWTVMGDDVNLAARVMGRAEPGTVLATSAVLSRLRDDFRRTPVPPFQVKGKAAAVFAEEVGEVSGARLTGAADGPLLGRERELAELEAALEEARAGGHPVVELVGEPGIGKSRLVQAALERAGGLTTLLVQGGPYSAHSPYRALQAPLRRLLGARDDAAALARLQEEARRDPALAPWLPLIAVPFGLDLPPTPETAALSPEFARARLAEWSARLIERLFGPGPAAVVVEDAHWLDDASGELLAVLARAPREAGRLVLASRRDVATGVRLGGREVRVEPIAGDAARELLADLALPPGDAELLIERAGGNPLLLGELIAAARAGDDVHALPDTVEALVTARMDTLPRADRRLLREASVLGIQVSERLLTRLLDADGFAVQAALTRLDGFLVRSGPETVRFRHALLRDAAYETLPFRRRRELHARAARIVEHDAGQETGEQSELLALHFHAAHEWPDAWRHARAAAGLAMRRAAPVEAAGFLARALQAGRALKLDSAELAAVAEELGDVAAIAGRQREAAEAYEEALRRRRDDPVQAAALCSKIGRQREKSRNVTQALSWYTRGLRRVEGVRGREATAVTARLILAHGAARMRAGRREAALPYLHRAIATARRCDDRQTLAHAAFILNGVLTDLGRPEADRYRDIALPIYVELGDWQGQSRVLNNLGINAYFEGRWDEAVELYDRSRRASERIGDVIEAATAVNNIAEIRSDQGRLDEAQALLNEALSVFRSAGFHVGVGLARLNLARVHVRRGDTAAAAEELERARALLAEAGAEYLVVEVDTREAERRLHTGEHEIALALAGVARLTARRLGAAPTQLAVLQRVAGLAKLQAGDTGAARVRLQESLQLARSVGAEYEAALALEALGHLGDEAAAAEAAATFRGLGVVAPLPLPA